VLPRPPLPLRGGGSKTRLPCRPEPFLTAPQTRADVPAVGRSTARRVRNRRPTPVIEPLPDFLMSAMIRFFASQGCIIPFCH
jgi:hypothetical protein